jgi:hypothetical protein
MVIFVLNYLHSHMPSTIKFLIVGQKHAPAYSCPIQWGKRTQLYDLGKTEFLI